MSGLTINNIHKAFGETQALKGVTFNINSGEIVALLGPSGCGKSTLLNIIAGLINPDKGAITWNGENLNDIPPHKRGFGLMFQDYLLFPHKNVGKNIGFGLEMASWSKRRIDARIYETLKIVNLNDYAQRDVGTLSGGEQQRVALARSLAPHPKLLMLDEPLGSLDKALRDRLLDELGAILRTVQQTALYVTHDQEEAFMLSNRVIIMEQGQVAQSGTPQEIYQKPASEFVARFLGLDNIVDGKYEEGRLETEVGDFEIFDLEQWQIPNHPPIEDISNLRILIRPDSMRLDGSGTHHFNPIILETMYRGSLIRIIVQINGITLNFELPSTTPLPKNGESVALSFIPREAIRFLS